MRRGDVYPQERVGRALEKLPGHSSVTVTMRYAHTNREPGGGRLG